MGDFVFPQAIQAGTVGMAQGGLSKREFYAGLALAGLLANPDPKAVHLPSATDTRARNVPHPKKAGDVFVELAWRLADQMVER